MKAWQWCGIVIMLVDFALLFYLRFVRGIDNSFVRSLLSTALPTLAVLCFFRARRYGARVEVDARQGRPVTVDSRPPVVFLRSFEADDKGGAKVSAMRPQTEEELLASLFRDFGPFLAIGKPHEKLPTLGASRLYVEDGEWEKVVSELMSRARLVVIRTGMTEGLLWEVNRAVRELPPDRLLLLVPFGRRSYEAFRSKAQSFFPRPLPPWPAWKFPPTSLQGVVIFEPDWAARFLPFKAGLWRGSYGDPSRSWRMGLQPVYERFGLPWMAPPINWLRMAFVAVLASTLLFAAVEGLKKRYRSPEPGEVAYLEFVRRLTEVRQFAQAAHLSGLEDYVLARILTTRGLHRMGDEAAVQYVALHRKLLESADEKACAYIAWGLASPRMFGEALDKLSPEEMRAWLALAELAALSELDQRPAAHPLNRWQLADARGRLLQGLPREVAQVVVGGALGFGHDGIQETCRAARVMFAKAAQAARPMRPLLSRAVVAAFH